MLLRKARLELDRPDEAERLGAELDALTWRDLSPEEQAQCPGLLVVGDSASLASSGLAQTIWALGSELPLRLLLLADLDLGLAGPAGKADGAAMYSGAEVAAWMPSPARRSAFSFTRFLPLLTR